MFLYILMNMMKLDHNIWKRKQANSFEQKWETHPHLTQYIQNCQHFTLLQRVCIFMSNEEKHNTLSKGYHFVCFETGLRKPKLTLDDLDGLKNTTNVYHIHLELRMWFHMNLGPVKSVLESENMSIHVSIFLNNPKAMHSVVQEGQVWPYSGLPNRSVCMLIYFEFFATLNAPYQGLHYINFGIKCHPTC